MKYSHKWLQKNISGTLPEASEIERLLTKHAFEVEEIVQIGNDAVLDIKVLPDRSHDALSYLGMAREIVSLINSPEITLIEVKRTLPEPVLAAPNVIIEDPQACTRFMAMRINNIALRPSTSWLKESLETIGQRTINTAVDATNYVLYDLGKPMHIFDADKVEGGIVVRFAKLGEKLTTLDGKDIILDETILVIADEAGPLSIAGIKGGTRAEVNINTTNIIIESANFDSALMRRTSSKLAIKTDAVKRFENGITSELCEPGLLATARLILEECGTDKTQISAITDVYSQPETWQYTVGITTAEINKVLGTKLIDSDTERLLAQRNFVYRKVSLRDVLEKETQPLIGAAYKNPSRMRIDAPDTFSCSSLVSYIYTLAGIRTPSLSVDKYLYGKKIEKNELQLGDLIFSNSGMGRIYAETVEYMPGTPVPEGVDHVGIYMGNHIVLEASRKSGTVAQTLLSESPAFESIVGYRRIVSNIDEKRYVVSVPAQRLDIRIKEDLIDDIGKLIGTDELLPTTQYQGAIPGNKDQISIYTSALRSLLISRGFSEIMTSSFSEGGNIAILNSVDPLKNTLRVSLLPGMQSSLEKGLYHSQFLGTETIQAFEIGTVFPESGERICISIGIASKHKKVKKVLSGEFFESTSYDGDTIEIPGLASILGTNTVANSIYDIEKGFAIKEFVLKSTNQVLVNDNASFLSVDEELQYKTLSVFPFIVRDVAFFISSNVDEDEIETVLTACAGDLCVKLYQFDRFEKEGQISIGYRLIFQAYDRTLQDIEIEPYMKIVYRALTERGCQIR